MLCQLRRPVQSWAVLTEALSPDDISIVLYAD